MCKQKIDIDKLYEISDNIDLLNDYVTAMTKLTPEVRLTPNEFLALFIPIKDSLDNIQNQLAKIVL